MTPHKQKAKAQPEKETTAQHDTETPNTAETSSPIRILKQASTAKLSARGQGKLTYEIGLTREAVETLLKADIPEDETLLADATWCRITANQSSGYFSDEWIPLSKIIEVMDQQTVPFKAIVFTSLYDRKGANNHGFLGAALKEEGLVVVDDKQPLILKAAPQRDTFWQQIKAAIQDGHDLPDHVAKEKARKNAMKQARLAEQQKRRNANAINAATETTTIATHHEKPNTGKRQEDSTAKTPPERPQNPPVSTDED